jgi:hypothetical protein
VLIWCFGAITRRRRFSVLLHAPPRLFFHAGTRGSCPSGRPPSQSRMASTRNQLVSWARSPARPDTICAKCLGEQARNQPGRGLCDRADANLRPAVSTRFVPSVSASRLEINLGEGCAADPYLPRPDHGGGFRPPATSSVTARLQVAPGLHS